MCWSSGRCPSTGVTSPAEISAVRRARGAAATRGRPCPPILPLTMLGLRIAKQFGGPRPDGVRLQPSRDLRLSKTRFLRFFVRIRGSLRSATRGDRTATTAVARTAGFKLRERPCRSRPLINVYADVRPRPVVDRWAQPCGCRHVDPRPALAPAGDPARDGRRDLCHRLVVDLLESATVRHDIVALPSEERARTAATVLLADPSDPMDSSPQPRAAPRAPGPAGDRTPCTLRGRVLNLDWHSAQPSARSVG